jgi:antitoxin (DNA-binding transcriptional repressor) of toxin-antitoxin stability system/transcription antitermination factor NusG
LKRKIVAVVTMMALILGVVVATPAVAADVTVSVDAPAQVSPDSDFAVNLNISEVTDFDACNYDVSYDSAVLRLDSVSSGLIGSTTIPVDVYNEIGDGTYRVIQNVPGIMGVSGSGYLAVLNFHVLGAEGDSSDITLSNGMIASNLAEEITATWVGGSVEVTVMPVEVSLDVPEEAAPNSDFTVNVNIGEVTDFDAASYDVTFDSLVLRLDDVTAGLIGATDIPVDVYSEVEVGTWRVVQNLPGVTGVSGSGYLAVLHFHVIGADGDSSALSLSNGVLSNNLAEEITATWTGGSVTIADNNAPVVTITPLSPDPTENSTPTFTGSVTDESNISSVEYRVDDGGWTAATASDGAFDSPSEDYTFTTESLADCEHTVYVRATDSAGNTTAEIDYASDSFTIQPTAPGDANGDGTIDVLDITRVERSIADLDPDTAGADANQDGMINVLDITRIERMIAGLE